MKTEIKIGNYNKLEFPNESDFDGLKLFITNQLKKEDLIIGLGFLYKNLPFEISAIGYKVEEQTKLIILSQTVTKMNPIIQKPKLEIVT